MPGSRRSARSRASRASARRRSRRPGCSPVSRWCSTSTTLTRSSASSVSSFASSPGRSGTRVRTTRKRPATASPRRITEISSVASMLPPESTRDDDAGAARPCRRGAPRRRPRRAPSTTSFVRSSSSTIASVICSSVTETMSSSTSSRIDIVSSPGFFTAIPSAIVKPGAAGQRPRRLHADDAQPGLHRAQRERDPGREPAAADRDQRRSRRRAPARRARARSSPGRRSRPGPRTGARTSRRARRRTPSPRRGTSSSAVADELDLRAVVARRLDLRHRRVLRHEDARAARRPRAPPTRPPGRGCPRSRRRRRPRAPPRSSVEMRLYAPRILNEPVRCRFSAFRMHLAADELRQRLRAVDRA